MRVVTKMVCSICRQPGHNKRSCRKRVAVPPPPPPPSVPVMGVHQEEDECPICMEPIHSKNSAVLKCGHKFHFECTMKTLRVKNSCPLCRRDITTTASQLSTPVERIAEFRELVIRNIDRLRELGFRL